MPKIELCALGLAVMVYLILQGWSRDQINKIHLVNLANLVRICIHILLAQDTACFADRPALL